MLGRVHIRDLYASQKSDFLRTMPVVDKQLARIIRVLETREGIGMTCVDGGKGLIAAIPTLFPNLAVQPLRRSQDQECPQRGQKERSTGQSSAPLRPLVRLRNSHW
jgi:hypothetical protein